MIDYLSASLSICSLPTVMYLTSVCSLLMQLGWKPNTDVKWLLNSCITLSSVGEESACLERKDFDEADARPLCDADI